MRFTKLIIIGVLFVVAGSVLIYRDQASSRTRACKNRIRRAHTAVCTWTVIGEARTWSFNFKENEELFSQFKEAMLADLDVPREEGSSEAIPEYLICITDGRGEHPFDFRIHIAKTSWIECGGGTYSNLGNTVEFLREHKKEFKLDSGD